jgi:hypothetical protein
MKKNISNTLLITSLVLFSASSYADSKNVAECGSYTLSQKSSSSYFSGIRHTQDSYTLTDSEGNSEEMEISLNSEGATLKSSYIPAGLTITAMWDKFELSVENDEKNEKIKCRRL